MTSDLIETWDEIALNWNKWAPPLRPSPEDIALLEKALKQWQIDLFHTGDTVNALLLGVTPEIATMKFPFPTMLTAVDKSANMISHVWPGDVPNERKAIQDDWLTMIMPYRSQDVVLADGSFVFFNPTEMQQLIGIVAKILKPNGVFIVRQFVAPTPKERMRDVALDLSLGKITNFHIFKFRLAMALQESFADGISQGDIWKQATSIIPYDNKKKLSETDSINFYKGKDAKLYFPTLAEFKALLNSSFPLVKTDIPSYDFGKCCPTFIARFKAH